MGSGFRVWTAGEVVSASNVNNYLQEQTVMSFAGTAARSSAIASPEEGMLSYLQDSDTYQGYDGTSWVNLNTLSGTDTSGLVHIETQTFSAVNGFSFSNDVFTSTYDNYLILIEGFGNSQQLTMRYRTAGSDNTTSNYTYQYISINNTTITGLRATGQTSTRIAFFDPSASGRAALSMNIYSPNLALRTLHRTETVSVLSGAYIEDYAGAFAADTVFDSVSIYSLSGNMTGKASLYGYRK